MTTDKPEVTVKPVSPGILAMPAWLQPGPPPLFPNFEPSESDRELARELFTLLDDESKAYYRRNFPLFTDL